MTEETAAAAPVNNTGRAIIMCVTLLFSFSTIVWLLLWGRAGNGLHETALSWSYMLVITLMAGLGFGAIIPHLPQLVRK